MRQRDKVIAIICSDLHLSQKPPRVRRQEPSWFDVMAHALKELQMLSTKYKAPILCAGDIFDHWRADPELVNFAIKFLPEMYAIPGQHDLPLHSMDLIKKSIYWTMVLVGKITPVIHNKPITAENNIVIHGFPWGTKIHPNKGKSKKFHIAICHDYFWINGHNYPGAKEKQKAERYKNLIKGYHAVGFGDNHKGFVTKVNGINVINCGTFMRRKADEEDYRPRVGLICESGAILRHGMKTSHETFTSPAEEERQIRQMLKVHDMQDFLTGLTELQKKSFDFIDALELAIEERMLNKKVRKVILEALRGDE